MSARSRRLSRTAVSPDAGGRRAAPKRPTPRRSIRLIGLRSARWAVSSLSVLALAGAAALPPRPDNPYLAPRQPVENAADARGWNGASGNVGTAPWQPMIDEASHRFGIPVEWIERVMLAESAGQTVQAGRPSRSVKGAIGLMQLMPGTWHEIRARLDLGHDPDDPRDNILAGTFYLRMLHERFGYPGLFAAYNAGPARYERYLAGTPLPVETIAYLGRVTGTPHAPGTGRPGVPALGYPSSVALDPPSGRGLFAAWARGGDAAHTALVDRDDPAMADTSQGLFAGRDAAVAGSPATAATTATGPASSAAAPPRACHMPQVPGMGSGWRLPSQGNPGTGPDAGTNAGAREGGQDQDSYRPAVGAAATGLFAVRKAAQ
ncbi:lytic transglycosylase domain-containing protein [Novosphingobium resinovorum]|uniref:lytic transglycosylase domain-containing protein n=1 Tax=Novosphingobium resinovorum TaxID=158500 RepID=UPI000ACA95ED